MKSYVLDPVRSAEGARDILLRILPDGVLRDPLGDPIAYFHAVLTDVDITGPAVIADISGRHYNEDAAVVAVLETIRQKVGGDVSAAP